MDDPRQRPAGAILDRRIGRSLRCRGCDYDLRGLRIDGRCPECGEAVWETVQDAIDPAARRLPLLRNPRGVGNGLLWLMSCLFLVTVLIILAPAADRLDRLLLLTSVSLGSWVPSELVLMAAVAAWIGIVAVRKLAPPRGKEPRGAVWRDIWLLTAGLVGVGAASLAMWALSRGLGWRASIVLTRQSHWAGLIPPLILLTSAIVTLLSLGGILSVIGERSRAYRNASGDLQRTREMIVALVGVAVGASMRQWGPPGLPWLPVIGDIVLFLSGFMLVLGMGYLLLNAWWIRRSLLAPPPTLEELLRDDRPTEY